MTELSPWEFPDGTELLISWLSPLGEVRSKRPIGAPLPFHLVRRIGGPDDGWTDKGLYSIHTWAEDSGPAMAAHNKLMRLANHRYINITVGQYVDGIECTEKPHEVDVIDRIRHYVGTYRVDVRINEVSES